MASSTVRDWLLTLSKVSLTIFSASGARASIWFQKLLSVIDGVSIYAVSKLLGHSSVAVTQKHYAHLATENLHADVNKIKVGMNRERKM